MTSFAYKDKDRKIKVVAADLGGFDSTRYYCPNPKCNAEMYLCVNNGSNISYFSANRKRYGHITNCWAAANKNFDKDDYDESRFSFNDLMSSLLQNSNQNVTHSNRINNQNNTNNHNPNATKVIRSVRNLYLMCKSLSPSDQYNNYEVENMLVDDRVKGKYANGFNGNKLVECAIPNYFYNRDEGKLFLEYEDFGIILNFEDRDLLNQFIKKIFSLKTKNKVAIVAGNWTNNGNQEVDTMIENEKQIWLRNY